jgi:hypothetical protein
VNVHTDKLQIFRVASRPIDRTRLLQRHAELVRLQAGGNIRMTLRVDIGIDPYRDPRDTLLRACDGGNAIEFTRRFGVDRADALRDRVLQLLARLAHAREHDVARRKPRSLRDLDLAAGVRVGAAAERTQQPYDRQRRIRFERVMDRVRIRRERFVDRAIGFADRARAVDVGRRARVLDDRLNADAVAGKCVACRLKRLVHERIACYHARIPAIEAPYVTHGC